MQSTMSFIIFALGYLAFGIAAAIWISKKKKSGEKISMKAKIIIAVVLLSSSSVFLSLMEPPPAPETNAPEASTTYYVKVKSANVRECPSTSCKVIDLLSQNTPLMFQGDLFDKYPDWAEITFPNGEIGYVSKTTLSESAVPESPLAPTDDSSSIGGIIIGPWANIQMTLGDSYEFHFCEPPSAISGATCGALADATTDPRGGTPPYSFVKKSGFLPPGITLELNGTLKGAPTQEGTYNFRLCAKDLYGGEGCQNIAVAVKKKETPPFPTDLALPSPAENISLSIDITGTCRLVKNVYDEDGKIVGQFFTAEFKGSASGPVNSIISIQHGQGTLYEQYGVEESWNKFESLSWTEDRGEWRRKVNDPPTTEWKYTRNNNLNVYFPSSKGQHTLAIEIRAPLAESIEKEFHVECP